MKRAFCAILFTTLVSSVSQAGYVGQINLGSSIPNPNGSLGVVNSALTGTGLMAPSFITAGASTPTPLTGGYLFFNTGTFTGTDAAGDTLYGPGGNFFVLQQNVMGSQPVYARDFTTDGAIVKTLTGMTMNVGGMAYQEYELTMSFSSAVINPPVFGVTSSVGNYAYGTIDFTFINDSNISGNQLISGSISFSVPEPSSFAMVIVGGLGLIGYGRRRTLLKRAG